MKKRLIGLAVVALVGAATAVYFLKPVAGPERDLTLVGDATRGDYVMRLAGCVACHTDAAAGGIELAGGAGLETAFGTFVPPNITSDPKAGIGTWTLEQFSDALSNGMGPQGHLYPAFPYGGADEDPAVSGPGSRKFGAVSVQCAADHGGVEESLFLAAAVRARSGEGRGL